jgi:hypothetical protein
MISKIQLYLLPILGLFCTGVALAQEEQCHVRLSAVALDSSIRDLKYQNGSKIGTLHAFKGQRSQTFDYSGPQNFVLYRETGGLDTDGSPIRIPVAELKIPGKSGQYMMLISKQSIEPEKYRIFAIPDDWSTFKPGTYRFLNIAPFEVVLKWDDKVHRIKESNFIDISGEFSEDGNYKAIMMSLPDGENPMLIFKGTIYYSINQRMLYLISPKSSGQVGKVNFTAIPQAAP